MAGRNGLFLGILAVPVSLFAATAAGAGVLTSAFSAGAGLPSSRQSTDAVVVSLGSRAIVSGGEADIPFEMRRAGFEVAVLQFAILLGSGDTAVYEPVVGGGTHPDDVQCQIETDLSSGFGLGGVVQPDLGDVIVSLIPSLRSFEPLPRDGVFGRCRFRVEPGTAVGQYPLRCDHTPDAASASDTDGNTLPIRCEDGEITVIDIPNCGGDCDGDGRVSIDELVQGVDILLGNDDLASCLSLDVNRDGVGSVDELLRAVGDALDDCQ